MNGNAEETNNVIKFPNSNWALFNENIRKSMKTQIKKVTPDLSDAQIESAIDGSENALLRHLAIFSRKFFSDLGQRLAHNLFEK